MTAPARATSRLILLATFLASAGLLIMKTRIGPKSLLFLTLLGACHHAQSSGGGDDEAKATAAEKKCEALVPPEAEVPSPGAVRANGRWSCVLSGGEGGGAAPITVVQTADGHINASYIRDGETNGFLGVVIGDQVHYRYPPNVEQTNGGILTLSLDGHTMAGKGATIRHIEGMEVFCNAFTLTCNR